MSRNLKGTGRLKIPKRRLSLKICQACGGRDVKARGTVSIENCAVIENRKSLWERENVDLGPDVPLLRLLSDRFSWPPPSPVLHSSSSCSPRRDLVFTSSTLENDHSSRTIANPPPVKATCEFRIKCGRLE